MVRDSKTPQLFPLLGLPKYWHYRDIQLQAQAYSESFGHMSLQCQVVSYIGSSSLERLQQNLKNKIQNELQALVNLLANSSHYDFESA
jgi:hypothetical protein